MKISYTHITSHQSSREGARIHGLVLHTTEGGDNPDSDLVTLGAIFDGEEASAHLGVNVDGKFGRYVDDSAKAWAVCNFNPMTLSLEQIGFAAFSRSEWFKRHDQLHGAAEFLQYGHEHYGVPIRKGYCSGGAITRDGVFQHKDFGTMGCGHSDCGPGYPQKYVELLARYFVAVHRDPNSLTTKRLRWQVNRIRKR
ncbi:MAG TPA: N-acetylmuramoyl-L-alanine amidase, partial [Isosphaeraceae bacterium]|nr:N-acetylmuramoyl-L-alanine amidase [Isosphaeraceae bacterium]